MNAVGKILVMLNFVMSLVFMSFAVAVYSTHKNWEEVVKGPQPGAPNGLLGQLDDLKKRRDTLQTQYDNLKREIEQELKLQQARNAALETDKQTKELRVKELETQLETITADKSKTAAAIDAAIAEVGKKSAETQVMSEQVESQRGVIADLNKRILALLDESAKLNAELAKAQSQVKILTTQIADLTTRQNVQTASQATPKVDGVVLAAQNDFVQISLGSDDGVKRGQTFEVYRHGATPEATKYLGRIEITATEPDAAVGRVLPDYRRGNIEKDDRVATRFN